MQALRKVVEQFSLNTVLAYMNHVQDNAKESVRREITKLKNGESPLAARQWRADIDFTGTAPQQTHNFNAPTAVSISAELYVFKAQVNDDIPLSQAACSTRTRLHRW